MSLPPTKHRGSIITHQDQNALRNVGRQAYRTTGDGIDVRAGQTGRSIAKQTEPEVRPNMAKAQHITAANAPIYGLVRLNDGIATGNGPLIATCRRANASGFGAIGSLQGGAQELDIVWVQHKGIGKVRFDSSTVPGTAVVPYRLGIKLDSYEAQYDMLGPIVLLEDVEVLAGAIHLGAVLFKGSRGDNKVCDTSAVADGPYRTIVWSSSYAVTQDSIGEISVDMT